jgi:hypothetical protein
MKSKNQIIQNFLKGAAFGFVALAVTVLLTGCGDDENNNNSNLRSGAGWWSNNYNHGGMGYNGYGQVSEVAAGVGSGGEFMVILATSMQANMGGTGFVEGELRLYMPTVCTMNVNMGLNAGIYQLVPVSNQPMPFGPNGLSNVQLMARGPGGQARVSVPYAYVFGTNVCGFDGMQGALYVHDVNGFPCNRQLFFTDMMANPGMCR